ncbi:hypothetical protein DJ94_1126 [Bacillus pseudomycoides]|nr:hypothetical protein DJ94_1126 [Bacillus pseudomycoides]
MKEAEDANKVTAFYYTNQKVESELKRKIERTDIAVKDVL